MGLDVSHDCWSGAYSGFHRWRKKVAEVAGYGCLDDYYGFSRGAGPAHCSKCGGYYEAGPVVQWPNNGDALQILLRHSDCDGEIRWQDCGPLADRLEQLLPALRIAGAGGGHIGDYAEAAEQFVKGLREAASKKENIEFC